MPPSIFTLHFSHSAEFNRAYWVFLKSTVTPLIALLAHNSLESVKFRTDTVFQSFWETYVEIGVSRHIGTKSTIVAIIVKVFDNKLNIARGGVETSKCELK